MTGSTTRRAAKSGAFFVIKPPIGQVAAGEVMGCAISDETWQNIKAAFYHYSNRMQDLQASKASRKKDDPQGWLARQTAATKSLQSALEKLEAARSKHGAFIHEASENYSLQTFGHSYLPEHSGDALLNAAFQSTLSALMIIERAKPQEIDVPTEATARDMLVRDIHAALTSEGIEARASTGFDLGQLGRPARFLDLTAFERLLTAFLIGDEKKPAAFAAFVRGALAGGNQG